MELTTLFTQIGLALGLGLLVGLERERAASRLAGIRTFALITLAGLLTAHLAQSFGGWVVAAGLVALSALIVVGVLAKIHSGNADPGLTTEIAMVVMFAVGAFLVIGPPSVSIVVGTGVAVLLHLKPEMHGLARRLSDGDYHAMMRFALISLVVLPVLPDEAYGPYGVLNPHRIWWMVVLIVGLGLAGYVAYKIFGQRAGAVLAGVLGGVISSTATTVAYARRSRAEPHSSSLGAFVVLLASAVVFVRLAIEVGVVAPAFLRTMGPIFAWMFLASVAVGALTWWRTERTGAFVPEQDNPAELKPALIFGALYALILLAVAAAREHLGAAGLYGVAVLSGLTDMDAITLSTSQLVGGGKLEEAAGMRVILIASMANLLFKGGVVAVLGHRRMFARVAIGYGVALGVGVLMLALL